MKPIPILLALALFAAPAMAQEQPPLPDTVTLPTKDVVAALHYLESRPLGETVRVWTDLLNDVQKSAADQRKPADAGHPPAVKP